MAGEPKDKRSPEQVQRAIDRLNLKNVLARVAKEHRWSASRADRAALWYRRFLWLTYRQGMRPLAAISRDSDLLWHYHILDTSKYAADCRKIFGTFLSHVPIYGPRLAGRTAARRKLFERSKKLYMEVYVEIPLDIVMDTCLSVPLPPPLPSRGQVLTPGSSVRA